MRLSGLALRGYRALTRPLLRWRLRTRDTERLVRLLAERWDGLRPPVFIIVMPKTLGWLEPCLKLIPPQVPVFLVGNGVSAGERQRIAQLFPLRPWLGLFVPPGSYAKHGTVLDLILTATTDDFILLDHDCYVFDPALFDPVVWRADEFLAAVDLPGFFTHNQSSGLKFPRTHFLVLRRERMVELRSSYGIGCEKVTRTPRRMVTTLARVGLGDHNFPPARMKFYDTLQLLMAAAFAEGWVVRELAVEREGIAHIGGTARWMNQLGLVADPLRTQP